VYQRRTRKIECLRNSRRLETPHWRAYTVRGEIVKRFHILSILCLLVSPSVTLRGQQAASGQVCVVFTVKDLSSGTSTRDYEDTITQAVSAAFEAGGFQLLRDALWRDAATAGSVDLSRPVSQADALAIASSVGADLAVTGVYFGILLSTSHSSAA
jgi:hypothetical protein